MGQTLCVMLLNCHINLARQCLPRSHFIYNASRLRLMYFNWPVTRPELCRFGPVCLWNFAVAACKLPLKCLSCFAVALSGRAECSSTASRDWRYGVEGSLLYYEIEMRILRSIGARNVITNEVMSIFTVYWDSWALEPLDTIGLLLHSSRDE